MGKIHVIFVELCMTHFVRVKGKQLLHKMWKRRLILESSRKVANGQLLAKRATQDTRS
jgi:hypothetical protein